MIIDYTYFGDVTTTYYTNKEFRLLVVVSIYYIVNIYIILLIYIVGLVYIIGLL